MRKFSRQRDIVLEILKKSYKHPTANEVFVLAREIDHKISLGTVYRNLDLLCEDGIIEKISTSIGTDRYDFKKSEHSHAICEKCGKVFDFITHANIDKIKKEVLNQTNLTSNLDEIRIIGICNECKTKIGE
jgi:Fe2+ or Zn2+ uptake regulation protein